MALWRLYYHLVWATKQRQPLITPDRERQLYPYIIGKADALGSIVHAIGGMEDHVYLVVSVPPSLSIADFVKNIKGGSAHYLNRVCSANLKQFGWQEGYGIFSLGIQQLERVVAYAQNQKLHHLNGTAIASLEEYNHQDDAPERWHPR